jgi:hypothetical protein
LEIQWTPLNVIILVQSQTESTKQLIAIAELNSHLYFYNKR